jgi:hypothetical protein
MSRVSVGYIKQEFDETLGYIRGDLKWLLDNSGLNYTIALLIGCGCEMLSACGGDRSRSGERIFMELLPVEWIPLAERVYGALRDGLAHGFDTKHLLIDREEHQIYLNAQGRQGIQIVKSDRGVGLSIGLRILAEGLCTKIDEFERLLQHDEDARERFLRARQPAAVLNAKEAHAWRTLVETAGIR